MTDNSMTEAQEPPQSNDPQGPRRPGRLRVTRISQPSTSPVDAAVSPQSINEQPTQQLEGSARGRGFSRMPRPDRGDGNTQPMRQQEQQVSAAEPSSHALAETPQEYKDLAKRKAVELKNAPGRIALDYATSRILNLTLPGPLSSHMLDIIGSDSKLGRVAFLGGNALQTAAITSAALSTSMKDVVVSGVFYTLGSAMSKVGDVIVSNRNHKQKQQRKWAEYDQYKVVTGVIESEEATPKPEVKDTVTIRGITKVVGEAAHLLLPSIGFGKSLPDSRAIYGYVASNMTELLAGAGALLAVHNGDTKTALIAAAGYVTTKLVSLRLEHHAANQRYEHVIGERRDAQRPVRPGESVQITTREAELARARFAGGNRALTDVDRAQLEHNASVVAHMFGDRSQKKEREAEGIRQRDERRQIQNSISNARADRVISEYGNRPAPTGEQANVGFGLVDRDTTVSERQENQVKGVVNRVVGWFRGLVTPRQKTESVPILVEPKRKPQPEVSDTIQGVDRDFTGDQYEESNTTPVIESRAPWLDQQPLPPNPQNIEITANNVLKDESGFRNMQVDIPVDGDGLNSWLRRANRQGIDQAEIDAAVQSATEKNAIPAKIWNLVKD